jgi:hypothetical protein
MRAGTVPCAASKGRPIVSVKINGNLIENSMINYADRYAINRPPDLRPRSA